MLLPQPGFPLSSTFTVIIFVTGYRNRLHFEFI